jgi:ASC-1-like (ASCH) protein
MGIRNEYRMLVKKGLKTVEPYTNKRRLGADNLNSL